MALEVATFISDLVVTNPDGAVDQLSTADDHLRLLKEVLKNTFPSLDAAVTATPNQLNGTFATGVKMLFQQTTAPTGWTKDTTHNDKALRVVSGAVGSGGSKPFTTTFGVGKTTDSHALTVTEMPAHAHSGTALSAGAHTHTPSGGGNFLVNRGAANEDWPAGGEVRKNQDATTSSDGAHTHSLSLNNTGGSAGHTHGLSNFDLQFVDIIIATRD